MGDYNTQIISAGIKRVDDDLLEELRSEILSRLGLCDSAYHATAPFLEIRNWHHQTNISMITQAKYNRGVEEFLDWLEPVVIDGLGQNETWAINFSEYSNNPTMRKLNSIEEDY